jgi:hypothetical protein
LPMQVVDLTGEPGSRFLGGCSGSGGYSKLNDVLEIIEGQLCTISKQVQDLSTKIARIEERISHECSGCQQVRSQVHALELSRAWIMGGAAAVGAVAGALVGLFY